MIERPFLALYGFFSRRRGVFWGFFSLVVVLLAIGASRVQLEEDITKFFPDDSRVQKLNQVFRSSRLAEKVVVMLSVKDSTTAPQPDSLVAFADQLVENITGKLSNHLTAVEGKVDDSGVLELVSAIQEKLPLYLEDDDYSRLDSLGDRDFARKVLLESYQQLLSPGGVVTKRVIVKDPLSFSGPVLQRLQYLQFDENFELYENYIVTRDHRHLLFFLQPRYPAAETQRNAAFQKELDVIIKEAGGLHHGLMASYFGGSVVAVGNAKQLQKDTILTVSIMIAVLLVVFLGYFRRKRIPFLILVPVVLGALFSLSIIALFKASLSILALAVGAVILGVAVDYSLHFLVHLKHDRDTKLVIRKLAKPLTMGSCTTVVAFLCLLFTNAGVLQDIGLFAALSLIGAALSSLIFLPHFIHAEQVPPASPAWLNAVTASSFERQRWLVYLILLLTPLFLYFAGRVSFNSDMGKLNFMAESTREANTRLEQINRASLSSVYILSSAPRLEESLRESERTYARLQTLKRDGVVGKFSSVSRFLLSDSLQNLRIARWNSYWTPEKRNHFINLVSEEAAKIGFSELVIRNFSELITKSYSPVSNDSANLFRSSFFEDLILEEEGAVTVMALANVAPSQKEVVYSALSGTKSEGVDRQMLTNLFVEYVNADFNYIVNVTALLVFAALLLAYGRIELTLITFVPMFITWIWILGLMGIFGIEFNIVNVMVSTFIFGLGDDYSIFITDGLQNEYRSGTRNLPSIRTSIFLSAVTTITGLGVLIFAKHPALRSIASISIIGISCVFVMSLVLQPYFFRLLISDRAKKGMTPMTAWGMIKTFYTYLFFAGGSILLTIIGLILKVIPFARKKVRLFFHTLLSNFTRLDVAMAFDMPKRIIGMTDETFRTPSVIIANHSSFLDILLTTGLHPKLILLTNEWVYNSPVFGGVVRLADYYPVKEGAEGSVGKIAERVAEGYSVVVFPEGTRSEDGKIRRFHKGAFYLAEHLSIPIVPLLIHGAAQGIKKGDMYLNYTSLTLKFLPPVSPENVDYGGSYQERTKGISRLFKSEFERLRNECETPSFFRQKLISNYLYKGPVLEWYLRIKLRLENNYERFDAIIPRQAEVLDLGCGYGFLAYMLQFLSEDRIITAVDYDEEKIETAQHGYLRSERLQFYCADVTKFPLKKYDAIVISDVLHYLTPDEQSELLGRCFHALHPGGRLIIRDGNSDLKERHEGTKLTEFFSIKVLGFNKSRQAPNFISGRGLSEMAKRYGLQVEVLDETRFTSNVIFVISKPEMVHAEV